MTSRGIEKAVDCLNEFKFTLANLDVKGTYIFATASLRNIKNTKEATNTIMNKTGLVVHVISSQEEATLDYVGASLLLDLDEGLLIDIGGSSTELVFYQNGQIQSATSLLIGCLSLHNKYVRDFLPTKVEINKIETRILKELDYVKEKIGIPANAKIICGVGGTVRATNQLKNELFDLTDDDKIIMIEGIDKIFDFYTNKKHEFLTQIIKVISDRLHTILPGMIVLNTIAKQYKSEVIRVREYGVREGYLYQKLHSKG